MTGDELDELMPRPARWNLPGRAVDAAVRWSVARDRVRELQAVDHLLPTARLIAARGGAVAATWALLVGTDTAAPGSLWGWLHTLAQCALFACAGAGILSPVGRATAFGRGWRDGRRALWGSAGEAMRRGMTGSEWLDAELTRDMARDGLRFADDDPSGEP